jgi:ElaB/YqjD/DUF883 family membrane-anchored ribosome-binding protein
LAIVAAASIGEASATQSAGHRPVLKRMQTTMATTKTTAAKPAARKAAAPRAAKKTPARKPAAKSAKPDTIKHQAVTLASQAGDRVRDAANQGKAKATDAMDDLATMVDDVARTLDEKLGPQYGDYARKAADAVSGVAGSLKSKDVDDLVADVRNFVKEKPAVAIGAAAAVGFVLTRLIKAGSDDKA